MRKAPFGALFFCPQTRLAHFFVENSNAEGLNAPFSTGIFSA
jgi:hypothetical protein